MKNSVRNILGILPSLGGSIESQRKDRREGLFLGSYIPEYESQFSEILYFSYSNENDVISAQTRILPNKFKIHRYLYCWLLPFVYAAEIRNCSLIRVMHSNGALPALIAKFIYGVPFVSTYGYDYVRFARIEGHPIKAILIRAIIPFLLYFANGIIVTTKELRDEVMQYVGNNKRIELVPNGVNCAMFKPRTGPSSSSEFKLLFVGRLEKQKNLFFMLEILTLLKDKLPVELTMVGSGSLASELREMATRRRLPVKFVSKVPYTEIAGLYQMADCFLSTSFAEGHPKALIEAMSCALPCVVSDSPGNSALIRHNENGLLLPLRDPAVWANQIAELASSVELRQKFGNHARSMVIQNFDHSITLKREIQFLKSQARQSNEAL